MEFYFSASNLPRDKFMLERVGEDPEGFVDLALLCTFSRMQLLLKSSVREVGKVSDQTIAGVADALGASTALVVSDNKRRVRRREVSCWEPAQPTAAAAGGDTTHHTRRCWDCSTCSWLPCRDFCRRDPLTRVDFPAPLAGAGPGQAGGGAERGGGRALPLRLALPL